MLPEPDRERLLHMRDAARQIEDFIVWYSATVDTPHLLAAVEHILATG